MAKIPYTIRYDDDLYKIIEPDVIEWSSRPDLRYSCGSCGGTGEEYVFEYNTKKYYTEPRLQTCSRCKGDGWEP